MKKYAWLLGLLAALFAGCGGGGVSQDPLANVTDAEGSLYGAGQEWVEQALGFFGDLLPASSQAVMRERSLTVVGDSEGVTLLADPVALSPTSIEDLADKPLFIVFRPTNKTTRPQAYIGNNTPGLQAYIGFLRKAQQDYEVEWYGARENGARRTARSPLIIKRLPVTGPNINPCLAGPLISWRKWGGIYVFDGCRQFSPERIHMSGPFPNDLPGQLIDRELRPTPIEEVLKPVYQNLKKPFEVEWPPAVLLRPEVSAIFNAYQNPRLREARQPDDLLGTPLGIVYLRTANGAKLTKADAARVIEVELAREESGYVLLGKNLRNPSETLRFPVREVAWCDGCWFPGMPTEIHLGIEDELEDPPYLFYLQINNLLLGGIAPKK
ncbi:hypothetical protein CSW25_01025 [Thermus scotoductus]|uniref:Lipoprotein n=1 Tax=Thermus scotoductus TaxID=37636 RepID=A0A430SDV7_THESC|nr:hypothetical protein CSW48_00620 [Thermus scotoductus]RTH09609.1 hypothetical protein CSW43_10935 [Thermus scotoductus]RTH13203.1 hypothetical protein CSW46_00400 [Thermus scotoductus]RTH13988.1 hypothetical protein CSW44_00660 [Thermus scotoductus]RTH20166.1 hypothetical protein CSW39_00720 [Thermus scotoductus]